MKGEKGGDFVIALLEMTLAVIKGIKKSGSYFKSTHYEQQRHKHYEIGTTSQLH